MRGATAPDTRLYALKHPMYCGRCDAERRFGMVQFASQAGKVCYECPKCFHRAYLDAATAPRKEMP